MSPALPFYIVTLTHTRWEDAAAWARRLPPEALPEVRLDLFPGEDPARLVQDLHRRCLVSGCGEEGSPGTEPERLARAAAGRPGWLELPWEAEIPGAVREHAAHLRILRSVRSPVFDLPERLEALPEGDAYAWTGVASSLADNGRLRAPLAWARDHGVRLSAALEGPRGIPARCLQAAWGGSFTYASPDEPPPPEPGGILDGEPRSELRPFPGLLPVSLMLAWRCHRLNAGTGLCGVLGPASGLEACRALNAHFQRSFKDLLALPLACTSPGEALDALEALPLLGLVLDDTLRVDVPRGLGLEAPVDTLWRRAAGAPWASGNVDHAARGRRFAGECGG